MKKYLLPALTLATLLGIVPTAYADAPVVPAAPVAAANSLKIGVIDVRQVMQKAPQMKATNEQLEKQFKPREAKIMDAQKALNAEAERLDKNAAVMSDADKTALQDKITADKASLQAQITSFQRDLNNAQNQAVQKILGQVADIVNKIAKDEKYDLILQGENVPYVSDKLNITNQVIKQLDAKK